MIPHHVELAREVVTALVGGVGPTNKAACDPCDTLEGKVGIGEDIDSVAG